MLRCLEEGEVYGGDDFKKILEFIQERWHLVLLGCALCKVGGLSVEKVFSFSIVLDNTLV